MWYKFHNFSISFNKDGVSIYPKSDDAAIGSSVKAVCYVRGEPFEGWYDPKGLKITTTKENRGTYVYGHGNDYTLVIDKVGEEHGGEYTCRGAFVNDTYSLTIQREYKVCASVLYITAAMLLLYDISVYGLLVLYVLSFCDVFIWRCISIYNTIYLNSLLSYSIKNNEDVLFMLCFTRFPPQNLQNMHISQVITIITNIFMYLPFSRC